MTIADAWGTRRQEAVLRREYPKLHKISVDYAVMEPASRDKAVRVACVKMPVKWLDVGSWPAYGQTLSADEHGNCVSAGALLLDSRGTLVASSDPHHVVATIGVHDLIIVHSDRATLVCRRDAAGLLKDLHKQIGQRFGDKYL
jgi:mannose-1-phosphate guanylyltransferase